MIVITVKSHLNKGIEPKATKIDINTTTKGSHTPRNCLKQTNKKINIISIPRGNKRFKSLMAKKSREEHDVRGA